MAKTRVYIAGHGGMVGGALARQLERDDSLDIITRRREELDLTDQAAVNDFFAQEQEIDQVYLAAARVGGIHANNTHPAEFIYDNLMIQSNVIHAAFKAGVKKLLFLGSSCIYPRGAEQPMREEGLLAGTLEPTNEPYAIAKIAGIKLCESYNRQYGESHGIDYRSVMPTNLYGPGDNYHRELSHVVPGLIRRFHEAKISGLSSVSVWGSGRARRDFLFVDDMAAACVTIMKLPRGDFWESRDQMCSHVNIGSGQEIEIAGLAKLIASVVGYEGQVCFDETKPDGVIRKLLETTQAEKIGWRPETSLKIGLQATYASFKSSGYLE